MEKSFLTTEQEDALKSVIEKGKNIAITGAMGTGKSTLYRKLQPMISEYIKDGDEPYTTVDEVACSQDLEFISNKIQSGRKVMFTSHYRTANDLTKAMPAFSGLFVHINKDRTCELALVMPT